MAVSGRTLFWMSSTLLILLVSAGCSGANLGEFDDSNDSREEMPGPGVLADENGNSPLTWSSASKQPESATGSAAVATSTTPSSNETMTPEQAEFEQYKAWNKLRTNGADSPEYQEFLQWLEYQKFKSSQ